MIDFDEERRSTLFKEPEVTEAPEVDSFDEDVADAQSAGSNLELKKKSSELAEREKLSDPTEEAESRSLVSKELLLNGFTALAIVGAIGAGIGSVFLMGSLMEAQQDDILTAVDSRTYTTVISGILDEAAEGLPSSTVVEATFDGTASEDQERVIVYEDPATGNTLKQEPVFGAEGHSYEISGTVAHYTIDFTVDGDDPGTSYSYDSTTDKISEITSEELY